MKKVIVSSFLLSILTVGISYANTTVLHTNTVVHTNTYVRPVVVAPKPVVVVHPKPVVVVHPKPVVVVNPKPVVVVR
ncbi:MAG: hypothetical protein HKM04_10830 [Legionellales bacterium]|nr:hypothetical protein [Legionellales bacterium]